MTTDFPTPYSPATWTVGVMTSFDVSISRPVTALAVVHVTGELDISTCPRFDEAIAEWVYPGIGTLSDLIIDFSRLRLLCAAGVDCLLQIDDAARAAQVRLQVVVSNPVVGRVLTLFDLDQRLRVQPDLATARRAAL
jgi:anti-anti-sigma factor